MRIVKFEDLEKLELISLKLENIPKVKKNQITADMKWLIEKLREAYTIIESAE